MFGQVYQIKIGPDNSIEILDWITIVKISDLLNTKVYGLGLLRFYQAQCSLLLS